MLILPSTLHVFFSFTPRTLEPITVDYYCQRIEIRNKMLYVHLRNRKCIVTQRQLKSRTADTSKLYEDHLLEK